VHPIARRFGSAVCIRFFVGFPCFDTYAVNLGSGLHSFTWNHRTH